MCALNDRGKEYFSSFRKIVNGHFSNSIFAKNHTTAEANSYNFEFNLSVISNSLFI
jgi:hypothetical protein